MDTLDLIQSIADKDAMQSERIFNELMADRIADKIEDRKNEIASRLFASRAELEASVDEYNESAENASERI